MVFCPLDIVVLKKMSESIAADNAYGRRDCILPKLRVLVSHSCRDKIVRTRTEGTVVTRHFARGTASLVRHTADTTHISLAVVVRISSTGVPTPLCYGMPILHMHLHFVAGIRTFQRLAVCDEVSVSGGRRHRVFARVYATAFETGARRSRDSNIARNVPRTGICRRACGKPDMDRI